MALGYRLTIPNLNFDSVHDSSPTTISRGVDYRFDILSLDAIKYTYKQTHLASCERQACAVYHIYCRWSCRELYV
jgi:hypothetical protein